MSGVSWLCTSGCATVQRLWRHHQQWLLRGTVGMRVFYILVSDIWDTFVPLFYTQKPPHILPLLSPPSLSICVHDIEWLLDGFSSCFLLEISLYIKLVVTTSWAFSVLETVWAFGGPHRSKPFLCGWMAFRHRHRPDFPSTLLVNRDFISGSHCVYRCWAYLFSRTS